MSQDSSVSIVTGYELNNTKFNY